MAFGLVHRIGAGWRKGVLALAAVASLATMAPPAAHAGGWDPGAAAAFGLIGGMALGAAIADHDHYEGPVDYGYRYRHWHHYPRYVYSEPLPDNCYVVRERLWVPGWGWEIRPRTVCE